MHVDPQLYRKAFQAYIRKGTPIEWSIKQERPTTHYIWRSRRDRHTRPTHRARDGQVFSWDNPPDGGHPGEDYNCRCRAEPYLGDGQEYVTHDLKGIGGSNARWKNLDFVRHFFQGAGHGVTLSEIGHLSEIAEQWAYRHGALERWTKQIIGEVREGKLTAQFDRSYSFENVQFSHGGGVVKGSFSGVTRIAHGMLAIEGETAYEFSDIFTDPLDIREWITGDEIPDWAFNLTELNGTAYPVTGSWRSDLRAKVFAEEDISAY